MKKNKKNIQLYEYEQSAWNQRLLVCGIDEVGRGCLAGPVVTAAAMLNAQSFHPLIQDSKLLNKQQLQEVYKWLISNCFFTIRINSPRIIDTHNIYQATAITMKQSLLGLLSTSQQKPSSILIDAMPLTLAQTPYEKIPCISLIKGESKSASIAAASIIAKVTRDNIMARLAQSIPGYGLESHKGYATKTHQSCIASNHSSIIHRQTFLKKILLKDCYEQKTLFC